MGKKLNGYWKHTLHLKGKKVRAKMRGNVWPETAFTIHWHPVNFILNFAMGSQLVLS